MALVFKLYGEYLSPAWPKNGSARKGSFEIHAWSRPSDVQGGAKTRNTYLRWVPGDPGNSKTLEDKDFKAAKSLHDMDFKNGQALKEWINAVAQQNGWLLCLTGEVQGDFRKGTGADYLSFEGIDHLEQYESQQCNLSLPLVAEFDVDQKKARSKIVIKSAKHKNWHCRFDLELGLPVPVVNDGQQALPAFPLRLVYYTADTNNIRIGQVGMLYALQVKDGELVADEKKDFVLNNRVFGCFDVADCVDKDSENFFAAPHSGSGAWANVGNAVIDALEKLRIADALKLAKVASASDANLRWQKDDDNAPPNGLIYRVALGPSKSKPLTVNAGREVGGTLDIGDKLYVDLILRWAWPNSKSGPDKPSFDVDIRLFWNETTTGKQFGATLLKDTFKRAKEARESVVRVEGARPVSALPEFVDWLSKSNQAYFALYLPPLARDASWSNGAIVWQPPTQPLALRCTLADKKHLCKADQSKNDDNSLRCRVRYPEFIQNQNAYFILGLHHESGSAGSNEVAQHYFASFALISLPTTDASAGWQGRIGSLAFIGNDTDASSLDKVPDFLRIAGRSLGRNHTQTYIKDDYLSVTFQIRFQVASVTPIAIDVARNDRRLEPTPLLIPISPDKAGHGSQFNLQMQEKFATDDDWQLTASLYDKSQQTGSRGYVLLSEAPFSILRFEQNPLSARGDAAGTEVAIYNSDDRIWQYKVTSPLYHYVLPPQAVGESADKPGRLELHDLPEDSTAEVPAPFVDGDTSGLERRAVEYRLTPSTEFWIRPSDVVRGYFMPEQASREIFRQRGEYGLGAALVALKGEFLYGLTVGVDVRKETSVARHARVAEIGALTGSVVGPAREPSADAAVSERWNRLSHAIARRPERFDIWAGDPESPVDFAPARFSSGVGFSLRETALHRHPLQDRGIDDLPSSPPGPRFHEQGLSGGALWPVASQNLLDALRDHPASDGGLLANVAFSPLGGDAEQKASFLGGIMSILSETRNGFVERHRVEVIGRIGAFWHRARHVVVYERTVNPSAQFAPRTDPDRTRSRRPILRKVSEYIELLEPDRAYPDLGLADSTARSCGFLRRVRFNSRIIPVDGAWGRDVGDSGWIVPLWNRASARERPQVYVMPDIAFVTAGEGAEDDPVVAQECLDPDLLCFHADFQAGTSDTDRWPAEVGIDYVALPDFEKLSELVDKVNTGESRGKAVSRFLPGARRFTWRLAPATRMTMLNAGRSSKPVYVGLESVSFMRPGAMTDIDGELHGALSNLEEFEADSEGSFWAKGGKAPYTDPDTNIDPNALIEAINALTGTSGEASKDEITSKYEALRLAWDAGRDGYASHLEGNAQSLRARLTEPLQKIDKIDKWLKNSGPNENSGPNVCDQLGKQATGTIQSKALLVRAVLQDWQAELRGIADLTDKDTAISSLKDSIKRALEPAFREASTDIGAMRNNVEIARAVILDAEADIQVVLHRVLLRLDQASAAYDRDKPWSPERQRSLRADLRNAASNVAGDVTAAMEEASRRLAVELNDLGQSVAVELGRTLRIIASSEQNALGELGTAKELVLSHIGSLVSGLDALDRALGEIRSEIEKARPTGEEDELDENEKLAQKALDTLQDVITEATNHAETIRRIIADIGKESLDAFDQLKALVQQATAIASDLVKDLRTAATDFEDAINQINDDGLKQALQEIDALAKQLPMAIDAWANSYADRLKTTFQSVDDFKSAMKAHVHEAVGKLSDKVRSLARNVDAFAQDAIEAMDEIAAKLSPERLLDEVIIGKVIDPALRELIAPLWSTGAPPEVADIADRLHDLADVVDRRIGALTDDAVPVVGDLTNACNTVVGGLGKTKKCLETLIQEHAVTKALDDAKAALDRIYGQLQDDADSVKAFLGEVRNFDRTLRGLHNDLVGAGETVRRYADRALEAAGQIGHGGVKRLPGQALRLYSAVSSAPEIAGLQTDIDRIRSRFDELSDIINTTRANALFNRLGDELKAIGLSLPFDRIGDRLMPLDLSKFDIGHVFRNFGGIRLDSLFSGYKLPKGTDNAIRVTHDFDKQQARAWVQVDIDAPLPGRRSLFRVGPFSCDFVDAQFVGQVRLEASKESDEVTQTGFGRLTTTLDSVVSGQSMVRFEKLALNFSREQGLKVEFDPKAIRLNPAFQFVQEALRNLFPDAAGPLTIIKHNGIPIGVEHQFDIPPTSVNAATSGISNISINNRFRLVAFPDFVIANRFGLSRPECPFIFSIFILGGTGYVQVESEYRPFDSTLTVQVDAAAGASAQLGLAFGPFSGQVFIALSAVLSYRRVIGRSGGGGLSVSALLVISGSVNVASIATVGIYLLLRMTYRDNGQIDADGTLSVTIRISRFFKLRARAQVKYRLRNGRSQIEKSSGVEVDTEDSRVEKARKAAERLGKAVR